VQNTHIVRRGERSGHFRADAANFNRRQRPAPEPLAQGLAAQPLHGEVRAAFPLAYVIEPAHVRVFQGGNRAGLTDEALTQMGLGVEPARQHLQSYLTAQAPVARQIHFSHPAFTQASEDVIVVQVSRWRRRPARSGRSFRVGS